MSLLSRPRHKVMVQHFTAVPGSVGQNEYVPDGAPVEVRCNVHLLSSSEVVSFGVRAFVDGTITATSWPWDEHTVITWKGVEYDQDAAAVPKEMSRRTAHLEIGIRERKKKAVPQ
jgi:hypothetical protein